MLNSLAITHPGIAAQWHPTKNDMLTPQRVTAGSSIKVWWQCPQGPDHEWQSKVAHRSKGSNCPFCRGLKASITNSLSSLFPTIAAQWHPTKNGTLTPEQVVAGSEKLVWWQCSINPLHEWPAMVADRVRGTGCPHCGHGWTLERIRVFVQAIQQHIETFTPAELYLLFQQNGLIAPKAAYRSFIRALATGRFPQNELEKFAQKEPSLVDVFFNDPHYTLEAYEQVGEESCENELPANIYPEMDDDRHPLALDSQAFPLVEASDVLSALSSRVISSADEEAVEFLTTSAVTKLWKHAFHDAEVAVSQARAFHGDPYAETVAQRFLSEYDSAQSLAIPEGYAFQVNSQQTLPNLMQRLVVVRLLQQKRTGNWSGTGAGKTLSAILASRVIHAHFTLICCPHSVVDEWASSIQAVFPDSIVATKTLTPDWSTLYEEIPERSNRTTRQRYLIVNYEAFQQRTSAAKVQMLLDDESLDFIVIDEIHFAKQRRAGNIVEVSRTLVHAPIPVSENESDGKHAFYGDFSSMNRLWNQARSETTHTRLTAHPEEWMAYHARYREARKEWTAIPFEEMLQWIKKRQGYVIGDFGCGEAQIAEALTGTHIVYSFDHVAINEQVITCDIAHVPLEDEILDVAVFSLSLVGANFTEYLREARRTLKLDGHLHIYEATSRFTDRASFCNGLQALGFDVLKAEDIWKFTHIHAIKSDRHSSSECLLTF